MNLIEFLKREEIFAAGNSEGAEKGWDVRGRGHKTVEEAKKNGYSLSKEGKDHGGQFKVLTNNMEHKITVRSKGDWQHELSGNLPTDKFGNTANRYSNGRGPIELGHRLSGIIGLENPDWEDTYKKSKEK